MRSAAHDGQTETTPTDGLGASRGAEQPLCPYLLDAHGPWRRSQPSRTHRCSARVPPVPIPALTQKRLCLTAQHPRCEHHVAAVERRAMALAADHILIEQLTGARFGATVRPLPVAIESMPDTRSVRDGWRRVHPVGVGGAAVAMAVVLLSIAAGLGRPPTAPGAVPPTRPSARTSSPSVAPATVPSRTPRPTRSAPMPSIRTPLPADTTPPDPPLPPGTRQYVVGPGDTLRSIARKLDTTVVRIRELNQLGDPPVIAPGQVILVPAP